MAALLETELASDSERKTTTNESNLNIFDPTAESEGGDFDKLIGKKRPEMNYIFEPEILKKRQSVDSLIHQVSMDIQALKSKFEGLNESKYRDCLAKVYFNQKTVIENLTKLNKDIEKVLDQDDLQQPKE